MQSLLSMACLMACLSTLGPHIAAAQEEQPATGFALWIRAPGGSVPDLFASAAGAPQFSVGYSGERFGLGVGLGLVLARSTDKSSFMATESKSTVKATLFQIGPSGWLDIWQSLDGRTRGNVAATVSVGRLSVSDKDEFTSAPGAAPTITETSSTGTLLGVRVGIGGDHFLHPHFALGLEAGLQGMMALGIEEDQQPPGGSIERVGLGANGTYATLRAKIVF